MKSGVQRHHNWVKEEQELWKKINRFHLGVPSDTMIFSQRVMRENGWSLPFTLRAILEYRKFIFLICMTNRSLCPSEVVDGVWHMHLLFTRNYWDEFCGNVLGRPIHHGPSRGSEEKMVHQSNYEYTLQLYHSYFGEPPRDIWPLPEERFKPVHWVRINYYDHFILSRKEKLLSLWRFLKS